MFHRIIYRFHIPKVIYMWILIGEEQDCIPEGCVTPACCPYLPACTALGGVPARGVCICPGGTCPGGCTCLGGVPAQGCVYLPGGYLPIYSPLSCEQNSWHTVLKILPCPNFVAGGNKDSVFETGHCLKDHNVHFKLSSSISGQEIQKMCFQECWKMVNYFILNCVINFKLRTL